MAAAGLTMHLHSRAVLPLHRRNPAPSAPPPSNALRSSLLRPSFPTRVALGGSALGCHPSEITRFASSRQLRPPRRAATFVVSASHATVVRVTPAAKKLYYNVVLKDEELKTGYQTPGQYVELQVEGSSSRAAYFFFANAPKAVEATGTMEFLIHDVPATTAHDLVTSKPGDKVEVSKVMGDGFDIKQLYPVTEVQTVLLFASGYGLGPIRAMIEAGFEAKKRSDVRLYYFFGTPEQEAYRDKYEEWERSGVKVITRQQDIPCEELNILDPLKTCALLCGSTKMQEDITNCLLKKGVPSEKILTVFGGYPTDQDTKVLERASRNSKFLEMGSEYVSFHKK